MALEGEGKTRTRTRRRTKVRAKKEKEEMAKRNDMLFNIKEKACLRMFVFPEGKPMLFTRPEVI